MFLGWAVGVALLVALLAGTIVGLVVIARRGVAEGRRTALPFGPFLALGGMVALLAGSQLTDLYLRAFG
jgi:leader peptidase (prepilin peptidase)/N-methyltransferase